MMGVKAIWAPDHLGSEGSRVCAQSRRGCVRNVPPFFDLFPSVGGARCRPASSGSVRQPCHRRRARWSLREARTSTQDRLYKGACKVCAKLFTQRRLAYERGIGSALTTRSCLNLHGHVQNSDPSQHRHLLPSDRILEQTPSGLGPQDNSAR